MKLIEESLQPLWRGFRASAFLSKFGIDPRRFWLLMELFDQLSDRGEMMDQLGRNGVALKTVGWIYAAFTGLMGIVLIVSQPTAPTYLFVFLFFTAVLLLTILLSEAGNSLVNPLESLILAHQPINGATYTAAKLTHLARIVLYLVPAINVLPAFAGLLLKTTTWSYPLVHLLAAFGVGAISALLCCALYGWLIRLVPASRLKAAAQLATIVPFLAMMWMGSLRRILPRAMTMLPSQPAVRWGLLLALGASVCSIVALGIRSLSADYLLRVSGIVHGQSGNVARSRKSWAGGVVAKVFDGQGARAGFAYVSKMMRRDFQFRRQVLPTLAMIFVAWVPMVLSGSRTDPFSGKFTTAHLLPHLFGLVLALVCSLLAYGNDFRSAWVFQTVPAQAFRGFAQGIYAALYVPMIVIPQVILLLYVSWAWGSWHAILFVAYSAAVGSTYLALELRLIEDIPFSRQVDPKRGAAMLPVLLLAVGAAGLVVGVQYFLVFRATTIVAAVTAALAAAAYLLTRSSLHALEGSMRYSLAFLTCESANIYKEIDS